MSAVVAPLGVAEAADVVAADRQRLLGDDVDARIERLHDVLVVVVVRRADDRELGLDLAEQLVGVAVEQCRGADINWRERSARLALWSHIATSSRRSGHRVVGWAAPGRAAAETGLLIEGVAGSLVVGGWVIVGFPS